MTNGSGTNGFWAGGHQAYADGLRQHYQSRLDQLEARRDKATTDMERAELDQQIQNSRAEWQAQSNIGNRSIF